MSLQKFQYVLREWLSRIVGTFKAPRERDDIEQELAFHIEETERALRERGVPAAEAHRLARVHAGNADAATERVRDQIVVPWVGPFTLDVRLGLRMLRKYWGLTTIGGIAIAVALSLSAALFAFFDVVWTTELPLDEGERVVAIQVWDPTQGLRRETSGADVARWRDELTTLDDFGAFRSVERTLVTGETRNETVVVGEMTASGFTLARTPAMLGRTFVADDERAGAEPVAVIGHSEWQRRFAGDPDILGRTIRLDGAFHTIVGVMPDGFRFPLNFTLWTPYRAEPDEFLPPPPGGSAFGRLAPGISLEQAQAELRRVGLLPSLSVTDDSEPLRLNVLPYTQNFIDDLDADQMSARSWNARLMILLASLLLIPPSVNIAILVYARTVTRHSEIAVRTALGASRTRIVMQLFIEMLVMTGLAAVVALVVLSLIGLYLQSILIDQLAVLPFWIDFSISWRTMTFVIALAVAAALIAGLVPALRTTRRLANPGLASLDGARAARLGGFWTTLVVAQVAFSFAALPAAVQLAWGVLRADVLGPGFPAEQYLSANISLSGATTARAVDSLGDRPGGGSSGDLAVRGPQFARAVDQLKRSLTSGAGAAFEPTVASAIAGAAPHASAEPEQLDDEDAGNWQNGLTRRMNVDREWFSAFDARLLVGRSFTASDMSASSRAVVVNQRFVERTLVGRNPVGTRIRYVTLTDSADPVVAHSDWYEIVGVVSDAPANPYRGTVYHPFVPESAESAVLVVSMPDSPNFAERLRDLAATTNPPLEVSEITPLNEVYERQAFGNYMGGFGLLAGTLSVLLLSAAGTYALMSFTVNQRRREIGIRVALGAPARYVLAAIFRRAFRQILIGAGVGVVIAWLIQAKIPIDSVGGISLDGILPAAVGLIVLIGLVATAGPARRALRVDPTETLRNDG